MQTPALYREGEGEPLILVHGFTATWRCWLPVADRLARRFEVIAPTLHGHDGGPEPPVTAHSTVHAADHLEQLLDVVEDVFATIRDGSARVVDLHEIRCPVLVAWGDRDRILPMRHHADRFRDEIRGVEFQVLEGLGHTPMWDDPDLVAATIGDFAERVQSAETAASSPVG